jgi:hypothetical protein
MDHGAVLENLQPYLDGQLAPGRELELSAHLDACAGCRAELARLREVDEALRAWPIVAEPEGFSSRVMEAILSAGTAGPTAAETGGWRATTRDLVRVTWQRAGWRSAPIALVVLVTVVILAVFLRELPAQIEQSGLDLWALRALTSLERQWYAARLDVGMSRTGIVGRSCFGSRAVYAPARYYCWVASSIVLLAAVACVVVLARQWRRIAGAIGI